ncbi:MAG TPA: hypothetical protein VKB25_15655 [Conexibacter sp.]|nr:hypothetical protein [Conexibacter sp.]
MPAIDMSVLVENFREPVESPLNPAAAQVQDGVIGWLRQIGFVTTADQERHLRSFEFGLYHALATPDAAPERLEIGMRWFCWGSLADDQYDNYEGPDGDGRMLRAMRDVRRIVTGRAPLGDDPNPVVTGLAAFWADLNAGLSARRQAWIAGHFLDYMQAIVLQNRYHDAGRIPDAATFLTLRRNTIAMIFQADVLEVVSDVRMPNVLRESLEFRELVLCFADVLAWHNDAYGLEKDVADHQTCNAVLVVAASEGCSTADAVVRVLERARTRQRVFLEIEAELPALARSLGLPPEAAAEAARLAADLRRYAFANIVWAQETRRYDLARPRIEGTFGDVLAGSDGGSPPRQAVRAAV